MSESVGFLALGGHDANQNAGFREVMEDLGKGYEFFGLENGFSAFKTGNMYPLTPELLDINFAGFYAGAGRASLIDKETGNPDPEKIDEAVKFVKEAKLDYLVASAGDDHGIQMKILGDALKAEGIDCKVLVISKTMDGDKGGKDGDIVETGGIKYIAPFADTTNGFHTAIEVGTNMINYSLSGAWTNNTVTIVSHFGRQSNWVNAALAWYGNADLAVFGELPKEHEGHSIKEIADLTCEALNVNKERYGRAFATMVVAEGTKIQGIEQVIESMEDVHGNEKLSPELLAARLKEALETGYNIKSQSLILTYELRNHPPSQKDLELAKLSGRKIAEAIREGMSGMEAALKFRGGEVVSELVPIELASRKRFVRDYPKSLYDAERLKPLPAIGDYFRPMFGERTDLATLLPKKPLIVNVYNPGS